MKYLSMGFALVRQWFPEVGSAPPGPAALEPLAVELTGTVGIGRTGDDRIEASIAGQLNTGLSPETRSIPDALDAASLAEGRLDSRAPVDARKSSAGQIAHADPFVWLQLLDDRGAPLTHETFLGHGVGTQYRVHARIEVPSITEPGASARPSDDAGQEARAPRASARLASGLVARVVARTYRNSAGPRYHTEVIVLTLLPAGAALPAPKSRPASVPESALALVPALAAAPEHGTEARRA